MTDEPQLASRQGRDDATTAAQTEIDEIVQRGPSGAFAVAGIATAIVLAMYFVFYVAVYLPRGIVQ